MPSGSITLANSVPAPPGVFATSMPPGLSSEDRDSSSDSNNLRTSNSHSAGNMVNGGGPILTQPLSTPNCAYAAIPPSSISSSNSHPSASSSKSPHFVMVRGESGRVGSGDDSYKTSNKIRKRNKSGRRLKEGSGRPNGTPPYSHEYGSSNVNKPLKVTIRRTVNSHTLGGQELLQQQQHSGCRKDSPPNSNSVIYSSVSDVDLSPPNFTTAGTSDRNISKQQPAENRPLKHDSPMVVSSVKMEEGTKKGAGPKAFKSEESISATHKDASTCTTSCGTITEPDLLGPCEPGSKIVLEGVVWLETPGMMVINASWRGRAYLGTLLDASKNSLGPSCPDKMISSLSMVRGRHNWGSSGVYRNSVNNSSKLFNSIAGANSISQLTATNGGVAMTTRAAAAAAAATDRTGTDEETGSTRSSTTGRRRGTNLRGAGGTKRKRRRGSANSSATNDHAPSTPLPAPGSESDTQMHQPGESESERQQPNQLICPQPGCEKRFSDMLAVRFHLEMGHNQARVNSPKPQTQNTTALSNKSRENEETSTSKPPLLAKAKTDSSVSLTYADDDQPPPQLDRGPDDEVPVVGNDHTEPPAASPAYSDISDDGASPMPSSVLTRTPLFQNGHRGSPSELLAAAMVAGLPPKATSKSPLLNNSSPVSFRTTSPGSFYMRAPTDFIGLNRSGVSGGNGSMNGSTAPQKSPYDFPSAPYHQGPPVPTNGLTPFGLQRSVIPPYPPHISRSIGCPPTSIHLPPQAHVSLNDNKRFQTHFTNVMAVGLPKSLSPQQMSRQSPQSHLTPSGTPFRQQ